MKMKLWQKNYNVNKDIGAFTVGNDYLLDQKLVKYDCLASIAHAKMLGKIKVLKKQEVVKLVNALKQIINLQSAGKFNIKQQDEDCHTAIENFLVNKLGNIGKKIHTARSRNDQVLVALRLYEKYELVETKQLLSALKKALIAVIKKHGSIQIPGYTHMQKAMPSSIKMWLGSFVYAIDDDIQQLNATLKLIDQSPLGSAAGFGVPVFDINKKYTAKQLGFSKSMQSMYSQMSRGKFEANIINVMTQVMVTLNKLATDMIMFSMKEFGYISLPKQFCTGSSIMPQKKNPDVLELVRAKYSVVLGEEFKVKSMVSNLISGYNRDLQLTKEPLMNSIEITKQCVKIMVLIVNGTELTKENKENCKKAMTPELYATEEAYKLVKKGMSFRDAYQKIGEKYK
ncbi:argininosuccinate lyase [Candidatus Woesearchaeota archaeon]|nr:argininosuccinate lyase [Candidatus Woesearchaeota archaeon]MBT7927201.1 argininosuccinate lyase [Candidatus Woesearchaeota archaeon]